MDTSFHYKNLALDIRTNDLVGHTPEEYLNEIKLSLGTNFDVVIEKDHIHCEPSPRSPYGKV